VTPTEISRRLFLKAGAIGAVGASVLRGTAWSHSRELTLYVGTYTSGKSEGIYVYRMDQSTGALRPLSSIKSVNPSFLAIDRSRKYLYAVNEVGEFEGKPGGAISAFAINSATGNLRFLNQQPSLGADPCHLTVDRKGKFLLVANYTGGNLAVLPIKSSGFLGPATDLVQHHGSSIKEQQRGPHAHCIILDRSQRYALAADLGIDKVMIYRFDPSAGKLKPNSPPSALSQPGAGPRHLTLHPRGKYTYVINELDSTVSAYDYDDDDGTLRVTQTVSTLPGDFSGVSYCADVHVSPSGKFLYGSNRGHDSIAVFAIDDESGKLSLVEHVSTQGSYPRNFTLHPNGAFLLVANQKSDTIVSFRIDPETGRLKPTGQVTQIPAPVCLKLMR
jgi:6-phosphogluconolactonase